MKETILEKAIRLVSLGMRFRVNLQERTLRVNKKNLIDKGVYEGELGIEHLSVEECTEKLLDLYWKYKHSIPTTNSETSRTKRYFNPLKEKDLSTNDFLCGTTRDIARIELELTLLIMILNGDITWEKVSSPNHYFWMPDKNESFVVLKEWVDV